MLEAILKPDEAKQRLERKMAKARATGDNPDIFKTPVVKGDGCDTVHGVMITPDSMRSELEYLAGKMRLDISALAEERYQEEQQAKQAEIEWRRQKKAKAFELHAMQMRELFLTNYGSRFFITLGSERLKKFKDFNVKCQVCGEQIDISGLCVSLAEVPKSFHSITSNPFNIMGGVPAIATDITCKNKHSTPIMLQQLF